MTHECNPQMALLQAAYWLARHKTTDLSRLEARMFANLPVPEYDRAREHAIELEVASVPDTWCMSCAGRGLQSLECLSVDMRTWLDRVLASRPKPRGWDQTPNTADNVMLDLAYIIRQLSNENRILFIGDDDRHSLVLAKLVPHLKIVVLDVDPEVVEHIRTSARQESLQVSAEIYDARESLPTEHHGSFEAFYCDPPYSHAGLQLFATRGLQALRDERGMWGAMALPFTTLPYEVRDSVLDFQRFLIEAGCVIAEFRPSFRYSDNPKQILSGLIRFERLSWDVSVDTRDLDSSALYQHWY